MTSLLKRPAGVIVEIPLKSYRNELISRTFETPEDGALDVRCGYMLKPTASGAYFSRTMQGVVMIMVLRGKGTFTDWTGRSHRVHAGSLIILPPDLKHSVAQDTDGQWAEFYIHCPTVFYQAMRLLQVLPAHCVVYEPGIHANLLVRYEAFFEYLRGTTPDDWPAMWARCHTLLADLIRRDRLSQRVVSSIRQQMLHAASLLADQNEHRLSLPALARKMGMGYESFRKHFKREIGLSPGEHRIRKRMELAQQLLIEHRLSNKEVAYRLGYADPFTFSKQFAQHVGQSPTAFRREHLQGKR